MEDQISISILPSAYQVTVESQETSKRDTMNTSQLIPTKNMCSLSEYVTLCDSKSCIYI